MRQLSCILYTNGMGRSENQIIVPVGNWNKIINQDNIMDQKLHFKKFIPFVNSRIRVPEYILVSKIVSFKRFILSPPSVNYLKRKASETISTGKNAFISTSGWSSPMMTGTHRFLPRKGSGSSSCSSTLEITRNATAYTLLEELAKFP